MVAELGDRTRIPTPYTTLCEVMCSWKEMAHAMGGPLHICPLSVVMGWGGMGAWASAHVSWIFGQLNSTDFTIVLITQEQFRLGRNMETYSLM